MGRFEGDLFREMEEYGEEYDSLLREHEKYLDEKREELEEKIRHHPEEYSLQEIKAIKERDPLWQGPEWSKQEREKLQEKASPPILVSFFIINHTLQYQNLFISSLILFPLGIPRGEANHYNLPVNSHP